MTEQLRDEFVPCEACDRFVAPDLATFEPYSGGYVCNVCMKVMRRINSACLRPEFCRGVDPSQRCKPCRVANGVEDEEPPRTLTTGQRVAALSSIQMLLSVVESGEFYEDYDESVAILSQAQTAFDMLRDDVIGGA